MKRLSMAILSACAVINVSAQQLRYPMAPHDSTTDTYFGVKVADPFRPLEDDKSPATEAWVRAETSLHAITLTRCRSGRNCSNA